jgi:uncharacterized membrane protein
LWARRDGKIADKIAGLLGVLPPEWVVFIIAMLPIVELRGAIPWALHPSGGAMGWKEAYVLAVAGNMVPVVPLLALLGPISDFLGRYRYTRRFFEWLFARTRRRGRVVEKYRALGLCLFVAIPLPITGAWTGTAAALVFGIPFRYALPAVTAGVLLAGALVTLASLGVISLWFG